MVRGISNISLPTVSHTLTPGGKMSLPVDSSSLIYSHFEHVSGTPAPKGSQGVSISKLNLLDVLIGQINQIKNNSAAISHIPAERKEAGYLDAGRLDARIDALIEAYKNEIRQAKAASEAMPYIPSPSAQSGAVFSLIA